MRGSPSLEVNGSKGTTEYRHPAPKTAGRKAGKIVGLTFDRNAIFCGIVSDWSLRDVVSWQYEMNSMASVISLRSGSYLTANDDASNMLWAL